MHRSISYIIRLLEFCELHIKRNYIKITLAKYYIIVHNTWPLDIEPHACTMTVHCIVVGLQLAVNITVYYSVDGIYL